MVKHKWHSSNHPGVRYREHPTRKHGISKDRYFVIRFQADGCRKEERLGWASEGWTAEKAAIELAGLKKAHITGEGATSLKEKREIEKKRRLEAEQKKARENQERISFGFYFENTYLPIAKTSKKRGTIACEKIYYNKWINPVLGDKPFNGIVPLQIEKIKQNLIKARKKPRTIEYIIAIIRQIWNMARRDGLIDRESPTKAVKIPKINNERQRFLSHDEAHLLLEHVRSRSFQTYQLCLISLNCGLRANEIFNLKWQQIDLDKGIIFVDGKGDKSRYAFMTERVKQMFSEMLKGAPNELVFQSRTKEKIQRVSNAFARSVSDLKLNEGVTDERMKVVFHTLRHTFASWLAQNGENLYVIQKLMGHASFSMVQRYSHLSENALQAAVKRLEAPETKKENGNSSVVALR